ncbi:hypothetical protein KY320_01320 [Candidatus Woesearchaeota archaeon]|nr:hypothetical protein [Candidatus Woesearchaeota archaeon]
MKDRITLTLESELLKRVDNTVDGHQVKNRSHAVELLLMKALHSDMPLKAIVLAGGTKTPLKSKFKSTPHVLTPVNGGAVIDHVIELFKQFGVNEIIFCLGQDADQIQEHITSKEHNLNLTFLKEKFPLGTAGPLRLAQKHINSSFFVANADTLRNLDLRDFHNFHTQHKGMATLALTTVDDPSKYGVANMTGNHILNFVEKPRKQNAPSNLINAGIYVMEPEVIDYIPEGFATLEEDVFPKLARENKLMGYAYSGQWFSIDTVEDYRKAVKNWKGVTR